MLVVEEVEPRLHTVDILGCERVYPGVQDGICLRIQVELYLFPENVVASVLKLLGACNIHSDDIEDHERSLAGLVESVLDVSIGRNSAGLSEITMSARSTLRMCFRSHLYWLECEPRLRLQW